jgi:hypothetical protein
VFLTLSLQVLQQHILFLAPSADMTLPLLSCLILLAVWRRERHHHPERQGLQPAARLLLLSLLPVLLLILFLSRLSLAAHCSLHHQLTPPLCFFCTMFLYLQYGDVKDTIILKDKVSNQPRGCAFVSYATKEEAEAAIHALDKGVHLPGALCPMEVSLKVFFPFKSVAFTAFSAASR